MLTWSFYVALAWAVIGLGTVGVLAWSHLRDYQAQQKAKRRLEIHRWALEQDAEALKAAAVPRLYRGYKTWEQK